ncbi:uncharacterized protein LOC108096110 [Drosophila ficusphila]|uniref:uncharacterized protein LOC108096110 n=1 Tax=Drosophila ficusphila TaxID=30025 RepID=UPI0007E7C399|nr:uncharacterized protein LOC108096110 [Drosophila ficusphila]
MSIPEVSSGSSVADSLRGRKVPLTRLTQKLREKADGEAKKVLSRAQSFSQIAMRTLGTRFESHHLLELDQWCKPRTRFHDEADVSLHPSYEIKQFSYDLNCFVRYLEAKVKYDKQFMREMAHIIAYQPNICEQFFLKQILCYKTRWPPLHTKRELNNFVSKFFQMTPKEKKRVEFLMKTNLSLGC